MPDVSSKRSARSERSKQGRSEPRSEQASDAGSQHGSDDDSEQRPTGHRSKQRPEHRSGHSGLASKHKSKHGSKRKSTRTRQRHRRRDSNGDESDDDNGGDESESEDSESESSSESSEMSVDDSSSSSVPPAKRRKVKAKTKAKHKAKNKAKKSKRSKRTEDISDDEREMREAIKGSKQRINPNPPKYAAVSHPLLTRRPPGWREDVDEPVVQQQFEAEKNNWLPTRNVVLHYQLYRYCLTGLGCMPFDIFRTEHCLRTQHKEGRPYFSPSPDELNCLCRIVVYPAWPRPNAHVGLVLALQFAAILRTNDQRPWSYIHEAPFDGFLRRMSEILREGPMPSRQLVETTLDDLSSRQEWPTLCGMVLQAIAIVFDEQQQDDTEEVLPAPQADESIPETYESVGADWRLIEKALRRIPVTDDLLPLGRSAEKNFRTAKATRRYMAEMTNDEALQYAKGSVLGIMRDRRARSLAVGQGNDSPNEAQMDQPSGQHVKSEPDQHFKSEPDQHVKSEPDRQVKSETESDNEGRVIKEE